MNLLFWCALLLGVFCSIYYIVIMLYAGIGVNFSWIWVLLGIVFTIGAAVIRYMLYINFYLPNWILIPVYILGGIAVMSFLFFEAVLLHHSHHKPRTGMDYLLVLGAQIRENKVTNNLRLRLDAAILYLLENPDTKVIVSGGRGSEELLSEAAVMRDYLLAQGVERGRILIEEQSVNTTENMKFSKRLIREGASVAIVTNGFHVYRSISLAKKQGMSKVFAIPTPTDKVMWLHYNVREAAGILKDRLLGNL